jgi:hypothetical protein
MLCLPEIADANFQRVRLWEDDLWRLSAVLQGPIPGFAHLEPRRHIPYITDLDGAEALTLGSVLAAVTSAAVPRDLQELLDQDSLARKHFERFPLSSVTAPGELAS